MSRPLVGPRLRRALAYLPWIASHPGASLDELAVRFDVRRADLERDLELLPFVGLPPYTPDRLIEVDIVDDCVWVRFADAFSAPLRFSAEEGVALLAAGTALLEVPGSDPDGPLAGALTKLAAALNAPHAVHVDVNAPDALTVVQDAIEGQRCLRMTYYSYHRNAQTERIIEPVSVAALLGHWYVRAYCRSAHAERLFRVDRIDTIALLDEEYTATLDSDDAAVYSPAVDDPRVTLQLPPDARWVLDTYPIEHQRLCPDGRIEVTLAVSTPEFLDRLLLRLGPSVEVAPSSVRRHAADTADRVLQRYRDATLADHAGVGG
ncbi:MAG: helix-turn-helix transcriptional regulator [Acidimicrobiia bacterium]